MCNCCFPGGNTPVFPSANKEMKPLLNGKLETPFKESYFRHLQDPNRERITLKTFNAAHFEVKEFIRNKASPDLSPITLLKVKSVASMVFGFVIGAALGVGAFVAFSHAMPAVALAAIVVSPFLILPFVLLGGSGLKEAQRQTREIEDADWLKTQTIYNPNLGPKEKEENSFLYQLIQVLGENDLKESVSWKYLRQQLVLKQLNSNITFYADSLEERHLENRRRLIEDILPQILNIKREFNDGGITLLQYATKIQTLIMHGRTNLTQFEFASKRDSLQLEYDRLLNGLLTACTQKQPSILDIDTQLTKVIQFLQQHCSVELMPRGQEVVVEVVEDLSASTALSPNGSTDQANLNDNDRPTDGGYINLPNIQPTPSPTTTASTSTGSAGANYIFNFPTLTLPGTASQQPAAPVVGENSPALPQTGQGTSSSQNTPLPPPPPPPPPPANYKSNWRQVSSSIAQTQPGLPSQITSSAPPSSVAPVPAAAELSLTSSAPTNISRVDLLRSGLARIRASQDDDISDDEESDDEEEVKVVKPETVSSLGPQPSADTPASIDKSATALEPKPPKIQPEPKKYYRTTSKDVQAKLKAQRAQQEGYKPKSDYTQEFKPLVTDATVTGGGNVVCNQDMIVRKAAELEELARRKNLDGSFLQDW